MSEINGSITVIIQVSMIINSVCQRKIDALRVNRMAKNWDWDKYDLITVNKLSKNGKDEYRCADGQHRLNAARAAGIDKLKCRVVKVDEQEEHRLFIGLNNGRKAQPAYSVYINGIMSGDKAMCEIDMIAQKFDVKITVSGNNPRNINCIGSIMALQRNDKNFEKHFSETVRMISSAWPGSCSAFNVAIIESLYRFLRIAIYTPRFDPAILDKRLAGIRPENLKAELPKSFRKASDVIPFYAALYNHGRSAKNRVEFSEKIKDAEEAA